MDKPLVLDWVKCVLECCPSDLLKLKNMLVMNSYHGHLTYDVKKRLQVGKTEQVYTPGGTDIFTPAIHVCINCPFKVHLKHFYLEWMATKVHEMTPAGRLEKSSLTLLHKWILAA